MRRVILDLLRCPRCRRGALAPESDSTDVVFGPIRCGTCQATYPVAEGVVDLIVERGEASVAQRSMENPWVARAYERYLRAAFQLAVSRRRIDPDSEFMLYRALLGRADGPILDLCCGTGLFARRLAKDPEIPAVAAMDVSKPMIEEGVALSREGGVAVDFLRAEAPELPFQDHSLGGILQTGALHLIEDAPRLLMEVTRVLKPGGRYLASTYRPPRFPTAWAHRRAGLHPRTEDELRHAIAAAGLVNFERVQLAPFLIVKAERSVSAD